MEEHQNQHYNMAAIVARYWKYDIEKVLSDSRYQDICLFDTNNFFNFSRKDRERNPNKKFFELLQEPKFLKDKVTRSISLSSVEDPQKNRTIDTIFTSLLISKQTESQLGVDIFEKKFLDLLENSNDLTDPNIFNQASNLKIIKDFIVLQYIRSPILYRFMIDMFLQEKQKKLALTCEARFKKGIPFFFEDYSLLDSIRIEEFITYANLQFHGMFNYMQGVLSDYSYLLIPTDNVHLGDLTTFFLDFDRFGVSISEIKKIIPSFSQTDKDYLSKIIYFPVSSKSCLIGFPKEFKIEIDKKYDELIAPILKNNFQNIIQFLYSQYIVIPPIQRNEFIEYMVSFFEMNDIKSLYAKREKNCGHIRGLESMIKSLQDYKKLYE